MISLEQSLDVLQDYVYNRNRYGQKDYNQGTIDFGIPVPTLNSLITIKQGKGGEIDTKDAFIAVLQDGTITKKAYNNRKSGLKVLWSILQQLDLVEGDSSFLNEIPFNGIQSKKYNTDSPIAHSMEELISVINAAETLQQKWALIVYTLGRGSNADIYNSTATEAGIIFSLNKEKAGRVVKVDPAVLAAVDAVNVAKAAASSRPVTSNTNSHYGIEAHQESELSELKTTPDSCRFTCLYVLRKSGKSWAVIQKDLDQSITSSMQQKVDALI
jgi:hypothetical protein